MINLHSVKTLKCCADQCAVDGNRRYCTTAIRQG